MVESSVRKLLRKLDECSPCVAFFDLVSEKFERLRERIEIWLVWLVWAPAHHVLGQSIDPEESNFVVSSVWRVQVPAPEFRQRGLEMLFTAASVEEIDRPILSPLRVFERQKHYGRQRSREKRQRIQEL